MKRARSRGTRSWKLGLPVALAAVVVTVIAASTTQAGPSPRANGPKFTEAKAFDVSKPLRELAKNAKPSKKGLPPASGHDTDSEPSAEASPAGARLASGSIVAGVSAQQSASTQQAVATIPAPLRTFEALSNQDNFDIFGFRVNPPDPVGDVGPNHYVEMINLVFAVYDKQGNRLLGPVDTGTLWSGFAVEDCTDPSGDPIVVYDQLEDRWILTQFTTRFTTDPENDVFYNCVAISQTGDPTGAYFRYAFTSGNFFPDYPKYGVWTDSYLLTSRDFGPTVEYGISVYALEKNKMLAGSPKARAVQFFLDSDVVPIYLMGDGLLPADIDGTRRPQDRVPAPFVGTMDTDGPYGAPFDALNVFELNVQWNSKPVASFGLVAQLPVNPFDSAFPCAPTSRDCLPQPGISNPAQFLDILSYRQRPTYRLAYRNFGKHEAMVTNQSVEARTAVAGVRWYEIRRTEGQYSVYQQGTFSPDNVHRWMGSIAMDKKGNAALGYSVVDGTSVFPGIRYTGRLAGDPLGQMPLGEGVIINGSGVQTTTNSRWGDYTSMNVDPVDDCTFWYVNEYYAVSGTPADTRPWQTRVASFKLPGCS